MKNAYEILDEEPEGKQPFVRTRHRWKDNTEMDIKKQGGRGQTGSIWLRTESSGAQASPQ
jgi:hypothetical protein